MSYQAEYIWIDGTEPTPLLRSKTRIVEGGKEPGIWGFDGSSTNQAEGNDSDCVLQPVYICPDPLRADGDKLVMSGWSTSHMTSLSPSARRGSGQVNTGSNTQSESLPSAWFVLEPSKPQIGGCLPSSTIFVLLRSSGVGSVPSIQMYSAW